jgi:hypothetical protein
MAVLAALLVFVGISSLAAAALAVLRHSLTIDAAALAVLLGSVAAFYSWRSSRPLPFPRPTGVRALDVLASSGLALSSLRHFLWLYFEKDGTLRTLNPNNYGDLPLHLTYIAYFVRGAGFWPQNPIFTGEALHYPFGVDLFTAMLAKLGLPLGLLMPAMGIAGAAALGAALFAWGRGFAVAAFLCSGGLAGFQLLWTGALEDYQAELAWKNLFLTLWVPQRGFLFALPAGLVLLWSWRRKLLRKEAALPDIVEGLLWGAMPLVHIHSFLFLSLIFALWVAAQREFKAGLRVFLWAVLPAAWGVARLTNPERAASFVWVKPGWLIGDDSTAAFLAVNFGFFLPLSVWAVVVAMRRRSREHLLMLVPSLAGFTILFFVMLAPAEWDNTKVMVWCYLLALPALHELVVDRLQPAPKALAWTLLFFSGAVCVASSLRGGGFEVARTEERSEVCAMLAGLDPDDRAATLQTFNHPVALCGQALVAGYGGHLWSHGIQAHEVEDRLRGLMMGEADWRGRAKDLGARYLFWGRREQAEYAGSRQPWGAASTVVSEGRWGRLYDLRADR